MFDFIHHRISIQDSGVMRGRTDRHSHILYGVDDGVATLEESLAVLAYEESLGVTDVWCTPHIMEDVPNTSDALRRRFDELCGVYTGLMRLHLAAEYMIDNLFADRLEKQDLLTAEGNILLVETSTWNPPQGFEAILDDILRTGYIPLLAHPERYRYLDGSQYGRLHDMGVRFQMNLGSVAGYYGENARKKATFLLEKGWYTDIGTDCHSLKSLQGQLNRRVQTGIVKLI